MKQPKNSEIQMLLLICMYNERNIFMSKNEVQTIVKNIISEAAAPDKEIHNDDSFFAIGINSVSIMKIQIDLAKTFNIKLSFRELSRYSTIDKLSEYLVNKIA